MKIQIIEIVNGEALCGKTCDNIDDATKYVSQLIGGGGTEKVLIEKATTTGMTVADSTEELS